MSRHRHLWISLVLLALVGCDKKDDGGKEKPTESKKDDEKKDDKKDDGKKADGKKADGKKDDGKQASSGEDAAKAFVAALASGDKKAVEALTPDAAACKTLDFKPCADVAAMVGKQWDDMKSAAKAYKDAKVSKVDKIPVKGAEGYAATVKGHETLKILTFKSGDKWYALTQMPGVKPPSTGNEMPQVAAMKPAEALEIVKSAMKAAKEKSPDCNKIADDLMLALPVALPVVNDDTAEPYRLLQRCSLDTKRWMSAVRAGVSLLKVKEPGSFVIAQIPRAFAEMGEHDRAIEAVKDLTKMFPKEEKPLVIAQLYAVCHAERWVNCLKGSEIIMSNLKKMKVDEKDRDMILARYFRNLAWTVLDKPKEAIADFEAMAKLVGVDTLKNLGAGQIVAAAQKAAERGFYLEVTPLPQFPTGVYHLMGKESTGSLVTIKLREQKGVKRTLRVELEVSGVTEKSSNSLEIGPRQQVMKLYNPPLKMDFDASKVRSARPSQLVVKITEEVKGGSPKTIIDETVPIEVLPRDYLPLRRLVGADKALPTFEYIGAWITSNDKTVEEFLTKAKARVAKKQFVGEQDETIPQIKALYDELKGRGMSYVMDPNVTSTQNFVQRTRLPAEVLTSTNAQCLEGTLTFATLMEAIGIKPIVVFVPGHAFVGWHPVAKDGTKGKPLFLETTMVGGYEFEQAVQVANARVEQEMKAGHFKDGSSTMIEVGKIRKNGFGAMPM